MGYLYVICLRLAIREKKRRGKTAVNVWVELMAAEDGNLPGCSGLAAGVSAEEAENSRSMDHIAACNGTNTTFLPDDTDWTADIDFDSLPSGK